MKEETQEEVRMAYYRSAERSRSGRKSGQIPKEKDEEEMQLRV